MGTACAKPTDQDAQNANANINKNLKNDAKKLDSQIRILLLGAGESGKSTIFKQMKIMHGDGFPREEQASYKPVIYENILRGIKTLVLASERLGHPIVDKNNQEFAASIKEIDSEVFLNPTKIWHEKLALQIEALWRDAGIQKTYEERSKFQLEDSVQYYFTNLKRISASDYVPSVMDILRSRMKTTGIVEMDFKFYNSTIRMIDVGGQRNERKKWIHCFEGVTAIIFVTSLSEYDQRCVEDDSTNRMKESTLLFSEICNSKYFNETPIILFLNKVDIFQEKIKTTDLNVIFEEYTGGCNYENAIKFIQKKFESLVQLKEENKKKDSATKEIFTHVTCATDTDQLKKVFSDIKKVILKDSLEKSGFL